MTDLNQQSIAAASAVPAARQATQAVAPALNAYTDNVLFGTLWQRPDLSKRDRSIVTLSAIIARNHTAELGFYLDFALDNGVAVAEISEIITHLAFYSGWGTAMSAVTVAQPIFVRRSVAPEILPGPLVNFLEINEAAEAERAAIAEQSAGQLAPGLVQFTTDALFKDLWLRPGLAPRDRSLVTISALVAAGHFPQITYHLNRAMDNGLTRIQASEVITHLAFYAGWPNAFSSVPVMKDVFERRAQ
jgi:4-carboxymuconolactone decarboxylase